MSTTAIPSTVEVEEVEYGIDWLAASVQWALDEDDEHAAELRAKERLTGGDNYAW